MSANAYLYRRNGTYYFRWSIPMACRLRMPKGEPCELRLSLRTTHPPTARHRAARCWLAALEAAEGFLVSGRAIRYNDLIVAIRTRARMPAESTAPEPTLLSLGAVAGTVEVQALKDTMAHLDRLGATFYLSVEHRAATLWVDRPRADGSLEAELIERVEDFADASAYLPRSCITAALAVKDNLLAVEAVFSRLPGMWEGPQHAKRPYEVRFDTPLVVNLSALLVDAELAKSAPKAAQSTSSIAPPAGTPSPVCDPVMLSKGLDLWLARNENWSAATKANYSSYVQQFIDIVGDRNTTDLTADHFSEFDDIVRNLPKNWKALKTKTGKTPRALSKEPRPKGGGTSAKTLKEKAATISQFFEFLEGQGYWHGRYGKKLFQGIKATKKGQKHRKVFSNDELKALFTGAGLPTLQGAKFALYVWGSVLLLYTGARPSEISQLRREDVIKDQDGTWYLRITASEEDDDEDHGKRLKTDASSRSVPLHPEVMALGFEGFLAHFQPSEPLFPEAMRHKQKVSRELGDWFNQKLLPAAGLKGDGAVLYSLRHTVIERFKGDASLDYLACAYVGHSTDEDAQRPNKVFVDTYGRAHSPATLAARLHPVLNFDIDWSPVQKLIADKDTEWKVQRLKLARAKKVAKRSAKQG